jgi:uroporphyrinogen III methyltransferase/synthase
MGTAYLVGAGPGDPKLLTRRGAELLGRADVVLHDALVDPALLALARHAEIIDVGRRAGESRWLTQERINRLLIELTHRHDVVVRLKGGDPLVFGRGGEEALALAQAGVPFEIVPGVTAGVGALAYAGIPLTHRGLATSAVFVTAHDREDPEREEEWRHIARMGGTVVVYMGGGRIRSVTERLIRLGRAPETPAAVVESGTQPAQRVVEARLDEIADRAGELRGPALIVVGAVARLHEQLEWVRPGPLSGRSVLVARARSQRSLIARALRQLGAAVVEFPTIRSIAAPDAARVPAAVEAMGARGAVVFTGAAALKESLRALARAGLDARSLAGLRLVAVGRETIAALRRAGLACDVPVRSYLPIRVAAAIRRGAGPLEGLPVLLIRDGQETSALGEGLTAAGAEVTQIEVATRVVDGHARPSVERALKAGRIDAVVLPSSSSAEALIAAGLTVPEAVSVIAIGPTTAATADRLGLPSASVPEGAGVDGLVAELVAALARVPAGERAERSRASGSSD